MNYAYAVQQANDDLRAAIIVTCIVFSPLIISICAAVAASCLFGILVSLLLAALSIKRTFMMTQAIPVMLKLGLRSLVPIGAILGIVAAIGLIVGAFAFVVWFWGTFIPHGKPV